MKTPDDQLLARWLDGELNVEDSARFEAMMVADPQLRQEAEEMRQISLALRSHVKIEREVPHADFFNSQIQERISEIQRMDERTQAVSSASGLSAIFSWLRAPWALAGAAAVLTLAFFVFRMERPSSQILSFYTPNPGIHATAYHSSDAGGTVLMLEGLETIPADRDIAGLNVHHSENDFFADSTSLFDDKGEVLLVMSKNHRSQPVFFGSKG